MRTLASAITAATASLVWLAACAPILPPPSPASPLPETPAESPSPTGVSQPLDVFGEADTERLRATGLLLPVKGVPLGKVEDSFDAPRDGGRRHARFAGDAPMTMTGKERAELRAEAHKLNALVHVGHAGANDAAVRSLDDVLRTHELVKVSLSKNAEMKPKELARQLSVSTRSEVIQVIGRTATFYRHNPKLKRKDGVPPWV